MGGCDTVGEKKMNLGLDVGLVNSLGRVVLRSPKELGRMDVGAESLGSSITHMNNSLSITEPILTFDEIKEQNPNPSSKITQTQNPKPYPEKGQPSRGGSMANRRCFKCQGLGHFAADCPNRQIVTLVEDPVYDEEPVYDESDRESEDVDPKQDEVIYALEINVETQFDVTAAGQVNDLKSSPGPNTRELRVATNQVVQLLQDNYPDVVAKQFVFAGPFKSAEVLFKYNAPEQLTDQFGGLKRYDEHDFTTSVSITEAVIKPASKPTIEFLFNEPGTLAWELRVLCWDVSYGAESTTSTEGGYMLRLSF